MDIASVSTYKQHVTARANYRKK